MDATNPNITPTVEQLGDAIDVLDGILADAAPWDPDAAAGDGSIDPTHSKMPAADRVFRHSGWQATRSKVRHALAKAGTSQKVLERFDTCGSGARAFWSPTQEKYLFRASYCRNRHCQPCMRAKGNNIARNLRRKLIGRPTGRYRFITLTLAHSTEPLPDQLRTLMKSWQRLRRSRLFKTQKGGAYFVEVKIGDDQLWHPHLHLLTEGFFLPQAELSREWFKITGNSYVCDVRAVPDANRVSFELTKYIAKGTSRDVWDDTDRAVEWIVAARGIRANGTFGTWRLFKLNEKPDPTGDLVFVGTLTNLIDDFRAQREPGMSIMWAIMNNRAPPDAACQSEPSVVQTALWTSTTPHWPG